MLPYCDTCHDVADFEVKEETKVKLIKGREIRYVSREAHCVECGDPLFVEEIHNSNLEQINEAYREAENLVRVQQIENALEMYNIGKRPLSLVLGWGEGTVTRYLDGDIPTKQYSETLKRILDEPLYLEELLEKNKDKITENAYRNCKEATLKLKGGNLQSVKDDLKKIDFVVQYLLYKCSDITPLALQKLLYYAQSFHKAINNEFLFENDCEAWVHGPVYRNVYDKYKVYGYNPIELGLEQYNFDELSELERDLLDSVIKNFGCYSGKILEGMTHAETPWRNSRKGLMDHEPSNHLITKESIEQYFSDIKLKYKILNTSDIRDYSIDLFNKIHHLS